ncbi:ABC transporter permease [Pedobacter caeni]|uniref:Putative ABC transport system permease protein n=1 Tax=Pedobacter caeni TaxID=288992 RepID=A0A1M5MRN1_9SPHI|nr:ABC transporter permease [Pedobacter caeni]SHG79968.1 putative ABC transport system permease protein [Pedobacter caeni]
MLKHLFKLIWNKKKENFLLISEILISFMVIFAVFTLLVHNYRNYKIPRGFDYEQVWSVSLGELSGSKDKDSVMLMHKNLRNTLKSLPLIKDLTLSSSNVPFSNSMYRTTVSYKGKEAHTDIFHGEISYEEVLRVQLLSGRWFSEDDNAAAKRNIVINELTQERLFGSGAALGKIISMGGEDLKVIGVAKDFKDQGDFKAPTPAIFLRIDTSNIRDASTILIRVGAGADATFEGKVYKLIASTVKSSNLEIKHLSDLRKNKNKETTIPMMIFFIVAGFLIFNVALGIFGVLWYNINKRRGEIGLRRAIGATASSVSGQLVGEAMVLATFSLIIGSFFAIQFPLLNVFDLPASVYLTAQFLATVFIYLLVVVCAFYPGKQAAAIYPAVVLHEE